MIAALYSSRIGGTKAFHRSKTGFGWSSNESVYRSDLYRAQNGLSRRVPGLKYAYIVRDSWTRLNVLPAKIMQVKIGIISIFNLLLLKTQQPYMLAAIREMSIKKADMMNENHELTASYLQACNFIFEKGILSHEKISSPNSKSLTNMACGMKWFFEWKQELSDEPRIIFCMHLYNYLYDTIDIKFRSPLQKSFLAWQV